MNSDTSSRYPVRVPQSLSPPSPEEVIGSLAAVRREAFRGARADGLTLTQIADELGVSVQAVSQVLKKRPHD